MTETPPRVRADAATGGLAIVGMVIFALRGSGLGSLVGLAVPQGLHGLFCGLVAGLVVVFPRFRQL